jgi:hypothetical protein
LNDSFTPLGYGINITRLQQRPEAKKIIRKVKLKMGGIQAPSSFSFFSQLVFPLDFFNPNSDERIGFIGF